MRTVLLYVLASISALRGGIDAHPLCYIGSIPPSTETTLSFCDVYPDDGFCCNEIEESNVKTRFDTAAVGPLTGDCATLYKEMVCGICQSYSGHLYERLAGNLGVEDGLSMKQSFCDDLVSACAGQVNFPDYDDGDSYCDKHALLDDSIWSHPIDPSIYDTTSTGLTDAFPDLPDSELPESLMSMSMTPDGGEWWLVAQDGQIWKIPAEGATSSTLVMDISGDFLLKSSLEEGLLAIAFSPAFNSNNFFYASYTILDPSGANRLARFTYSSSSTIATANSVEVLITTKPKATAVHAGGWVGFKPSDYNSPGSSSHDLYWSIGDGGLPEDTDGEGPDLSTLLATIVRISVPSSSTGSGYSIPSGNRQGGMEEICANGFRNPFRCGFDRMTDDLYCGDVGQISVEEISKIQCGSGSDYGWSVMEGSRCQEAAQDRYGNCVDVDRSQYTFPIFEYCHQDYSDSEDGEDEFTDGVDICGSRFVVGSAVIGGPVYRGEIYSEVLDGAVIFAEHTTSNIYFLIEKDGKWFPGSIVSDNSAKVISFAEDNKGELYIVTLERKPFVLPCGDLCSTTCLDQTTTEIVSFEYIGCFNDVTDDRALTLAESPKCDQGENAMSPMICASYCATIDGAELFGVQFGSECYCGSASEEYDKHGTAPSSTCDALCIESPGHSCDGQLTLEVYSFGKTPITPAPVMVPTLPPSDSGPPSSSPLLPPMPGTTPVLAPVIAPTPDSSLTSYSYLGCFGDSNDERVLTGGFLSDPGMTTEVCANFCEDSEYFGTEFSTQCFCSASGDDFDALGEVTCAFECGGAPNEICGGSHALSVYAQENADDNTDDATDGGGLGYTALGCFLDNNTARVLNSDSIETSTMTTDICANFCSGHMNFGTEFGIQCFCGMASSSTSAVTNCNYPCAGDSSEICGGYKAINIYSYSDGDDDPGANGDTTFPGVFLGCYGDSKSGRIMGNKDSSPGMTTQLCASLCEGFAFYGTRFREECWCSDSDAYDIYGEVDTCTMSCSGDSSQICGGLDAMSVYMF